MYLDKKCSKNSKRKYQNKKQIMKNTRKELIKRGNIYEFKHNFDNT